MEQKPQFNVFKLMKKVQFQSTYFFSLVLFSSSLVLLILHSMKSYSILSLVSVMKFNIDRNHVFLICNGILVILVKSSSSSSSSPSQDSSNISDYSSSSTVHNDQSVAKSATVLSDQKRQQQEELPAVTSAMKVTTTDINIARLSTTVVGNNANVHVRHEKSVVSECHVHINGNDHEQEDDHDDEEGAEELNKRCEEFIRRMKQGIISESKKDLGLSRFN